MRPAIRAGGVLLGGALLVAPVQAWLWAALAPGVQYQVFENQTWAPVPTETLHIFTAFSLFALMGVFVGAAVATAGWSLRSVRGVGMLVWCGVTAGLGSLLAGLLGEAWAAGVDPAVIGAMPGVQEVVTAPAVLTGWPAYLAAPTAAVVLYTFLVSWNGLPDLGRDRN